MFLIEYLESVCPVNKCSTVKIVMKLDVFPVMMENLPSKENA